MSLKIFSLLLLVASPLMVVGQQPGASPEVHPPLTWQKCTKAGSCTAVHGSITMDHNWRWLHTADSKNCMNNNQWDATACPDPATCAKNCQLDGINYATYGITTNGASIDIKKGARLYMMANETSYEMFKLVGQEFTFDVDMSKLPCGLNGALYLVSMEHDGGAHNAGNKAGAKYGTGYCDAQCPKDTFINGKANFGSAQQGACCAEMDLWEANAFATVYTPHPCTSGAAIHYCEGSACPGSTCESGGCGFNSYAMGNHNFYGPGKTVDSHKVMTVVTQFISSDGTANGHLTEIRRFYVQGGKVIPNSHSTTSGFTGNSLTTAFCDKGSFSQHGGLKSMGDALHAGMVLTFSLWGDYNSGMEWLDAGNNGPCPTTAQVAATGVEMSFSNIKVGPINSTFHA